MSSDKSSGAELNNGADNGSTRHSGADIPTLIFDGDCGVCSNSVNWLHRQADFQSVPFQAVDYSPFKLSPADVQQQVWLIEGEKKSGGVAAFARVFQRSPKFPIRVAGYLLALPVLRHIAQLVYQVVAKYRHRLPGGTAACRLPNN